MIHSFWIPGQPIGKARARVFRNRHTGKCHGVTPAKTRAWEDAAILVMRMQWRGRAPALSPVYLRIEAIFDPPKKLADVCRLGSGYVPHTAKPDWDNVGKAVSDALQKAGVIRDDSQVHSGSINKHYACPDSPAPGVYVTISYQGE